MVKKMFEALKKRYSNLGLSDDQYNLVAPMAVLGLSDDADDAVIAARASESYISDMLKSMQSQSDKIRSLERKPKEDKGVVEPAGSDAKMDEVLELLKAQKASSESLQARLDALEGAKKQESFGILVDGIMKELKIPASLSDLCRAGLSSDMDEKTVREKLGASKKALADSGIQFSEGTGGSSKSTQTEAEKAEAEKWAKEHAIPE